MTTLNKNIIRSDKGDNIKQPQWLMWAALAGYLISYVFIYIRYTYFSGATTMRFPVEMLTMSPLSNDLYVSAKYAVQTLRSGSIEGVPFVYSPLFVILFSPLSYIEFNTLRWIVAIITILSYCTAVFIMPRYWGFKVSNSPAALVLIIAGFMSYGFRFELERGQWNILVVLMCLVSFALNRSLERYIRIIGYSIFTVAVHLKVWPVIFAIGFIKPKIGIYNNIKRLMILGCFNFILLFSLGVSFFYKYFKAITHASVNADVWIANLSFHAFNIQAASYYSVNIELIKIITAIIVISILVTILISLNNNIDGDNPRLLILTTCCAILIPSVSFDYKITILSIVLTFFLSTINTESNRIIKINAKLYSRCKTEINVKQLINNICIIIILLVYPISLYSYQYKLDLGVIGASNTLPITIIGISTAIYTLKNL